MNDSFATKSNKFSKTLSTRQSTKQKIFNYFNVFVFKRQHLKFSNERKIIEHKNKIVQTIIVLLTHDET